MSFLYPSFLWALLAIAIPIIIHLFYFRRFKKVYFTNVRFLKEVKEETSSRSKIKHLLVLLSRILALAFLVFAFAQPYIPQKEQAVQKGRKAVSLFVDNSYSMSSLSQDVPLLEKAKDRARQIISAYGVEDEFQVLTNDFERRHQRLVSKEDALGFVDEIKISPAVKVMSKIVNRQKQALNSSDSELRSSYIVSDFQKNITDFKEEFGKDTTVEYSLIPLQSVQKKNVSIDSCWFQAPVQMLNQTNPLVIKVRNLSDEDVDDVRLTLTLDNQVKPLGSLGVKARSAAYDTVNVTILRTGWHEAELGITDYPVQFDDKYFFSFPVAQQISILVVNESSTNNFLSAAFQKNEYFKVDQVSAGRIDYSKFLDYQLIVLNDLTAVSTGLSSELLQFAKNGGNVLAFPNKNANINAYKAFLSSFQANELERFETDAKEVSYVNLEEFVFNDVFENVNSNIKLPSTKGQFKLTKFGSRREEVLLRYRDGNTFIGKYRQEKGNLFLCAAPLNVTYNDLVRNGDVFVPMLYKMALSTGKDHKISYAIGSDNILETDNRTKQGETVYKMKGSQEEFIPEQRNIGVKTILGVGEQVKEAGFYKLFLEKDNPLASFAFNYDRKESELEYLTLEELKTFASAKVDIIDNPTEDFTTLIDERKRGIVLWKWFLIIALAFLLIETLLIRFWKV